MANLGDSDIEKVLETIIRHLKEQKLLGDKFNETVVIAELTPQIKSANLENNDVHDPNVQKRLMGVVVGHVLGCDKMKQENLQILGADVPGIEEKSSEAKRLENPKLDHLLFQATSVLQVLKEDAGKAPAHLPQLKPELLAKKLLANFKDEQLKKCDGDKEKEKNVEKNMDLLEKQLADALKMMYGGDDPRMTGEVPIPIIGAAMTNANGWNMTIPDPNSKAIVTDLQTYNTDKPDYNGFENTLAQSVIAAGVGIKDAVSSVIDSVCSTIENECGPSFPKTPELKHI